jgi:hypothetical protein
MSVCRVGKVANAFELPTLYVNALEFEFQMLIYSRREENRRTRRKTLGGKGENQQTTQLT